MFGKKSGAAGCEILVIIKGKKAGETHFLPVAVIRDSLHSIFKNQAMFPIRF